MGSSKVAASDRWLFNKYRPISVVQSTLDISKSRFILNYCYLKVYFLVPENLLRDNSSLSLLHSERPKLHRVLAILSAIGLIYQELKCEEKNRTCVKIMIFAIRGYFEISVFKISKVDYILL